MCFLNWLVTEEAGMAPLGRRQIGRYELAQSMFPLSLWHPVLLLRLCTFIDLASPSCGFGVYVIFSDHPACVLLFASSLGILTMLGWLTWFGISWEEYRCLAGEFEKEPLCLRSFIMPYDFQQLSQGIHLEASVAWRRWRPCRATLGSKDNTKPYRLFSLFTVECLSFSWLFSKV